MVRPPPRPHSSAPAACPPRGRASCRCATRSSGTWTTDPRGPLELRDRAPILARDRNVEGGVRDQIDRFLDRQFGIGDGLERHRRWSRQARRRGFPAAHPSIVSSAPPSGPMTEATIPSSEVVGARVAVGSTSGVSRTGVRVGFSSSFSSLSSSSAATAVGSPRNSGASTRPSFAFFFLGRGVFVGFASTWATVSPSTPVPSPAGARAARASSSPSSAGPASVTRCVGGRRRLCFGAILRRAPADLGRRRRQPFVTFRSERTNMTERSLSVSGSLPRDGGPPAPPWVVSLVATKNTGVDNQRWRPRHPPRPPRRCRRSPPFRYGERRPFAVAIFIVAFARGRGQREEAIRQRQRVVVGQVLTFDRIRRPIRPANRRGRRSGVRSW